MLSEKLSTSTYSKRVLDTDKMDPVFRPIHYLGSKLRILDFIESTIDSIDPDKGRVCDLFAGSGSVSFHLAKTRPVTSVDIQNYSSIICEGVIGSNQMDQEFITYFTQSIENSAHSKNLIWCIADLSNYESECIENAVKGFNLSDLSDILENGSIISFELNEANSSDKLSPKISSLLQRLNEKKITPKQALCIKYFGGIYFSFLQAAQIDVVLEEIEHAPVEYRTKLLSALLSTVSECVNTVGKQFAQPINPRNSKGEIKPSLGRMVFKDRALDVFSIFNKWLEKYNRIDLVNNNNSVLRMDFEEALNQLPDDTSVIYADPPYTRDHYSRFYHVLETISLRDMPDISTMVNNGRIKLSRGLYRKERHQSPFCIRSQAPDAFGKIFSIASKKGVKLIISYSPYDDSKNTHPRVVTMEQLLSLAKSYYENVEVLYPGIFTHSKLNVIDKHLEASENAEVLIVCT